jgi:hypothetical protein
MIILMFKLFKFESVSAIYVFRECSLLSLAEKDIIRRERVDIRVLRTKQLKRDPNKAKRLLLWVDYR